MIIEDTAPGKRIILSQAFDSRIKVLNIFYFLTFFLSMLLLAYLILSDGPDGVGYLFLLVIVIVFGIAGYRFINKALETEVLLIDSSHLTIARHGFLRKTVNQYVIAKISGFRHLDKSPVAKHPLAGDSFDYLGFQTEQQLIDELHGEQRAALDYEGAIIRFGENLYSWDFEQLEILLYDITGNDLRYDDGFERDHFRVSREEENTAL